MTLNTVAHPAFGRPLPKGRGGTSSPSPLGEKVPEGRMRGDGPSASGSCATQLGSALVRRSLALRTPRSAVARSPDLATRPTEGLPETGAGVKETFGPARGGVWRPAPSAARAQRNCEALSARAVLERLGLSVLRYLARAVLEHSGRYIFGYPCCSVFGSSDWRPPPVEEGRPSVFRGISRGFSERARGALGRGRGGGLGRLREYPKCRVPNPKVSIPGSAHRASINVRPRQRVLSCGAQGVPPRIASSGMGMAMSLASRSAVGAVTVTSPAGPAGSSASGLRS